MAYTASQVADAVWTYTTRTLAAGSSTTGTTKAAIIADAVWSYSVRHLTTAMPTYNIQIDDDFNRAATTVGTGANSTTGVGSPAASHFFSPSVGAPWIDYAGNEFNISSSGNISAAGISNDYDLLNALYRPSVENMLDGRVRVWAVGAVSASPGAILRFSPASGGSGYEILYYINNGWYGTKKINGVGAQGNMFTGVTNVYTSGNTAANFPSAYVMEVTTSTTGTSTTFTMKAYAQTDTTFANPLVINTYTDVDSTLSATPGSFGTSFFNSGTNVASRVQIAAVSAGGSALASGSANGSVYKTKARLTGTVATGGTAPYSYQWFRSNTSGQNGTAISGATSLSFLDSGLTPATQYFYILRATDSASTPATIFSNQFSGTTLAANGVLIGFLGDSITYGAQGSTPGSADPVNGRNAVSKQLSYLIANGIPALGYDQGIPGTKTTDWISGSTNLNAVIAQFQASEITHVQIMLGTNDSGGASGMAASTYQSNLTSAITALQAALSGIKIVLTDSPYIDYTTTYGANYTANADVLLQSYRTVNASLSNGSTVFLGDTASYAFFQSNLTQLFDGVHPTDTGYASLGGLWGVAFKTLLIGTLGVTTFSGVEHTVTVNLGRVEFLVRHVSDTQIDQLRLNLPGKELSVDTTNLTVLVSN